MERLTTQNNRGLRNGRDRKEEATIKDKEQRKSSSYGKQENENSKLRGQKDRKNDGTNTTITIPSQQNQGRNYAAETENGEKEIKNRKQGELTSMAEEKGNQGEGRNTWRDGTQSRATKGKQQPRLTRFWRPTEYKQRPEWHRAQHHQKRTVNCKGKARP